MTTVELISKDQCHLCEEALEVLNRVLAEIPFDLQIRKLQEGDPEFELYRIRFPVVLIDGEFGFQYRVPEKPFRMMLRKKSDDAS